MRILISGINFAPELTGIGKYTGELAEYLAAAGHELRVVTAPPYYPQWRVLPGYSGWLYQTEHRSGAWVVRCPLWVPKKPGGMARILHLASFALSSLPALIVQLSWKPDLVLCIAPAIFNAPFALLAARLAGAAACLHIQDFELDVASSLGMIPIERGQQSLLHRLESLLYRSYDRVSTISQAMVERLCEKGVPGEAVLLFPNWVDTQAIYPLREANGLRAELGLPNDELVVLYSGNMGRKQGLEIVVEAAALLENDPGVRFVLCGDGAARGEIEALARGLPNVVFLPLQPPAKLNDLLNMADIHVLPQRAGAADLVMPSKLTGMLASGKPVIATAKAGSELYAVISQVGRAMPPEDAVQFAGAIRSLTADPTERARLGALGRKYVEAHWEKERVLGDFVAALTGLRSQAALAGRQSTGN